MKTTYMRCASLTEALGVIAKLAAKTVILDVEPLIAYWDSGQQELDHGVARVLGEVASLPSVLVVCFATNSRRRPSVNPAHPGTRVEYLASGYKPFRIAPYDGFPAPGVLVGDQIATDGLLARRLGYTFVHCTPEVARVPTGPRLLDQGGRLIRPLLFRQPG